MTAPALSPLGNYLRQYDSDAFLATLLAPPRLREDFFALLAFRHEIESIRSKVTEPLLGRIRLQWWREAVQAAAAGGKPPAHEVMQPLGTILAAGRLPAAPLLELLDAHEPDFAETSWQNMDELEAHALAKTAPLLQQQIRIAGLTMPDKLAHVATGMGLVRLIGRGQASPLPVRDVAQRAYALLEFPAGWSRAQRRLLVRARLAKLRLHQYEACAFDRDNMGRLQTPPLRGLVLAHAAIFG